VRFLQKFADSKNAGSIAVKFRLKRFSYFKGIIVDLPKPVRILDVGGTENFWLQMGYRDNQKINITLLNNEEETIECSNISFIKGDAGDLSRFADKEFDVVFSNSVIEHIGNLSDRKKMADEIHRVGKRYFVQTPNYYFPLEPHFLFPLFQFFPRSLKISLLKNFNLGWFEKCKTKQQAEDLLDSIHLLKQQEFRELFTDGKLHKEKFFGFTKSFVLIKE
jgi:ubiquinone/menaquinone biosynthesis C-methylase UbiE